MARQIGIRSAPPYEYPSPFPIVDAGGDKVTISHDGTDAYFKTDDGTFIFQTDEGVNTATFVQIKGKGTGYGGVQAYDQDDSEYMTLYSHGQKGYLSVLGGIPGSLNLNSDGFSDVELFGDLALGNPYFYIYGFKTADAVKYGRMMVDAAGLYNLDVELGMILTGIKSGINQAGAGAAANELWHDTTDDTIKRGT